MTENIKIQMLGIDLAKPGSETTKLFISKNQSENPVFMEALEKSFPGVEIVITERLPE